MNSAPFRWLTQVEVTRIAELIRGRSKLSMARELVQSCLYVVLRPTLWLVTWALFPFGLALALILAASEAVSRYPWPWQVWQVFRVVLRMRRAETGEL